MTNQRSSRNTSTAVVAGLAMALLVILVHQKVMGYDEEGCSSPRWTRISQDDDGLLLRQHSGRCKLEVDLRGDIRWNDMEDTISWIAPGGRLEVDQRTQDTRHRLKVRGSSDGTPQVEYWRDGDPAQVDADARIWFHDVAMVMFRRAGIDAAARSNRIYRTLGADGLVDEMDAIDSDEVAARYARAAFAAPADELAEVLEAAARRIGSDTSAAELLVDLAHAGLPQEQTPALLRSIRDALGALGSDYELRRAALALLESDSVTADLGEAVLEAAAHGVGSDYDAAEIVAAIGHSLAPKEALPASLIDLLRTIDGDYEMRRSLEGLIAGGRSAEDLETLLTVARKIGSDYDLAEVLTAIAKCAEASPVLEPSFRAALQLIGSGHERERAEQAWREKNGAPS